MNREMIEKDILNIQTQINRRGMELVEDDSMGAKLLGAQEYAKQLLEALSKEDGTDAATEESS